MTVVVVFVAGEEGGLICLSLSVSLPLQISYLVLVEPMSECMIVGAIASWSVSILFHWDFLAFYLIHILCWFLSDWMLLTIVQVSAGGQG